MPNAMPGELGPGWRRGAAKDKALLKGGGGGGGGVQVTSFRDNFKEKALSGFWLVFFSSDSGLVCVGGVGASGGALEKSCGDLQSEKQCKHTPTINRGTYDSGGPRHLKAC